MPNPISGSIQILSHYLFGPQNVADSAVYNFQLWKYFPRSVALSFNTRNPWPIAVKSSGHDIWHISSKRNTDIFQIQVPTLHVFCEFGFDVSALIAWIIRSLNLSVPCPKHMRI